MKPMPGGLPRVLTGTAATIFAALILGPGPSAAADAPDGSPDAPDRVTVAEARDRARLLHSVYAATLDAMHHRFFRADRSVLPARAMEDVFADMDRKTNIKAAWIAVNTQAMNLDHQPKSDFEKQAARAIAAGKGEYELVEKGAYRRAGAIPLGAGCVNCHSGMFGKAPPAGRFAGLVISIPVREK